jgi:hypothetical protein
VFNNLYNEEDWHDDGKEKKGLRCRWSIKETYS